MRAVTILALLASLQFGCAQMPADFGNGKSAEAVVPEIALREHFAGACNGPVRPIMKVEAQRVRVLSPDSAVVTGTYSFGRTDRPGDKPWRAFFVVALVRGSTGWLVVSQETVPMPAT
jgi:hypothetical protein